MPFANKKRKRQWVVAKLGRFATVGGGLGARPKVYDTPAAAQYDIQTRPQLRGGTVQPYKPEDQAAFEAAADKVNKAAVSGPGEIQGPAPSTTGVFATTTKSKAVKPKGPAPKRPTAAAGKVK